jgi:predicted nucleic acid-binding protein
LIVVDTNILLDLATDDSEWFDWSRDAMQTLASDGALIINAVIYAELSARYASTDAVDDFIGITGLEFSDIPRGAAYLAAKAFGRYRATGGTRTGVLSDFFIGAHAATLEIPILTRDTRRYRTYFPDVRLISPPVN